jgi:hypothetical protein
MKELDWIKEQSILFDSWGFKPLWEMSKLEMEEEAFTLHNVIRLMLDLKLTEFKGMDLDCLEERLEQLYTQLYKIRWK